MSTTVDSKIIRPQRGRQEQFAKCKADICIFGGARFGGKSFGLLIEPLYHIHVPEFRAVGFRRDYPRITSAGGLWDEARKIYTPLGARCLKHNLTCIFPSKAEVQFRHLEHDDNLTAFLGAQIPLILFDQVEECSEHQFWYLQGSNRSTCGVTPYLRATVNPDPDSWVAKMIEWWIDEETGYPISSAWRDELPDRWKNVERSGRIRWIVRADDQTIWFGTKAEAVKFCIQELQYEKEQAVATPVSFTFIPATMQDNPIGMQSDPRYIAKIRSQTTVNRLRWEKGNWKVRALAGDVFPRNKWRLCERLPDGCSLVRSIDKASTESGKGARTAMVLVGHHAETQRWFIGHGLAKRMNDIDREETIKRVVEADAKQFAGRVVTLVEKEPGSGGKSDALRTVRNLAGYDVRIESPTGPKVVRWRGLAAQVQIGNVWICTEEFGGWDWQDFINEMDRVSGNEKDNKGLLLDHADASSAGFNYLTGGDFFEIDGDLVASGEDPREESKRFTDEEIEELPEDLAELVRSYREDLPSKDEDDEDEDDVYSLFE